MVCIGVSRRPTFYENGKIIENNLDEIDYLTKYQNSFRPIYFLRNFYLTLEKTKTLSLANMDNIVKLFMLRKLKKRQE